MAARKFTRELINKRIEILFGNAGEKEGQYYFDAHYCAVCKVITSGGGIRRIINASSPSRLLDILDGIATYLHYKRINKILSNKDKQKIL